MRWLYLNRPVFATPLSNKQVFYYVGISSSSNAPIRESAFYLISYYFLSMVGEAVLPRTQGKWCH